MFEGDLKQHEIAKPVVETEAQSHIRMARDLLSDPARWYQGEYCNDTGDAFCIYGALNLARGARAQSTMCGPSEIYVERAIASVMGSPVVQFNDSHATTHGDVLAAFDLAYELASTPT